jgi:hypothetical protein
MMMLIATPARTRIGFIHFLRLAFSKDPFGVFAGLVRCYFEGDQGRSEQVGDVMTLSIELTLRYGEAHRPSTQCWTLLPLGSSPIDPIRQHHGHGPWLLQQVLQRPLKVQTAPDGGMCSLGRLPQDCIDLECSATIVLGTIAALCQPCHAELG